jgi:hypothetical protein
MCLFSGGGPTGTSDQLPVGAEIGVPGAEAGPMVAQAFNGREAALMGNCLVGPVALAQVTVDAVVFVLIFVQVSDVPLEAPKPMFPRYPTVPSRVCA